MLSPVIFFQLSTLNGPVKPPTLDPMRLNTLHLCPFSMGVFPCAGACILKAPETFQAGKATFSSSVSKNGEVYMPETSCMKGTSLHVNKTAL